MSALGQSLHIDKTGTFAQCPLCLQERPNRCVAAKRRFVPKAAVSNRSKTVALFDHLVGTDKQRGRYG